MTELDNKTIFVYEPTKSYSGGLVFVTEEGKKEFDNDVEHAFVGTFEDFKLSLLEEFKHCSVILYYEYLE